MINKLVILCLCFLWHEQAIAFELEQIKGEWDSTIFEDFGKNDNFYKMIGDELRVWTDVTRKIQENGHTLAIYTRTFQVPKDEGWTTIASYSVVEDGFLTIEGEWLLSKIDNCIHTLPSRENSHKNKNIYNFAIMMATQAGCNTQEEKFKIVSVEDEKFTVKDEADVDFVYRLVRDRKKMSPSPMFMR